MTTTSKKIAALALAGALALGLTACGTTVSDQIANCSTKTLSHLYHTKPELYYLSPKDKDALETSVLKSCVAQQKDDPYGFEYKYGS